mgnify:CR=1 FL=1
MQRRLLLAAALAMSTSWAQAQTYPNKPIRLIVTFPSGGAPEDRKSTRLNSSH